MLLTFNRILRDHFEKVEEFKLIEFFSGTRKHPTGSLIEICGLLLCDVGKSAYIANELLKDLPIVAQSRSFFTEIKNTHNYSI